MRGHEGEGARKAQDLRAGGIVGNVVGRYGREKHVAAGVCFSDGQRRLFWPENLEEVSSSGSWCRSLIGDGLRGMSGPNKMTAVAVRVTTTPNVVERSAR